MSDRKDPAGSSLLNPRALVLTQIASFQLHLEHLTVSSARVQRCNSQGKLPTPNSEEAVQAVALGWEERISKAWPASLGSACPKQGQVTALQAGETEQTTRLLLSQLPADHRIRTEVSCLQGFSSPPRQGRPCTSPKLRKQRRRSGQKPEVSQNK